VERYKIRNLKDKILDGKSGEDLPYIRNIRQGELTIPLYQLKERFQPVLSGLYLTDVGLIVPG
jgi:hypothetical protein